MKSLDLMCVLADAREAETLWFSVRQSRDTQPRWPSRMQRGRASAFVGGCEKGGRGTYACACQDDEVLLTAFCSLAFSAKSQPWG